MHLPKCGGKVAQASGWKVVSPPRGSAKRDVVHDDDDVIPVSDVPFGPLVSSSATLLVSSSSGDGAPSPQTTCSQTT